MKKFLLLFIIFSLLQPLHAQAMMGLEEFKKAAEEFALKTEERFKKMENDIKEYKKMTDKALADIEKIAKTLGKIERLGPEILSVKGFIKEGIERLSSLEKSFEGLKDVVAKQEKRMNTLEKRVSFFEERGIVETKRERLLQKGAFLLSAIAFIVAITK